MDFKRQYLIAKKNGKADVLRGEEISRRIEREVPISDQIAILADRDKKPAKFQKYQELRASKIKEVDLEILSFLS